MKITNSSLLLSSERSYQQTSLQKESLTLINPQNSRLSRNNGSAASGGRLENHSAQDRVQLAHRGHHRGHVHRQEVQSIDEEEIPDAELNIRILAEMVKRLTGKFLSISAPQASSAQADPSAAETTATGDAPASAPESGIIYEYYESYFESEQTSFSANGIVNTADGQSLDISIQLSMSREFMSEQSVTVRTGAALKDPLVINFSGNAVELTQRNFSFDIDADGHSDQIAFTGSNSGLLALDISGDGQINDGRELFGTLSGDGFSDLSSYDEDKNGWIDESDSIYQNLRIWTKDSAGNNKLFALGEKGIGAIYLNHASTNFSLNSSSNEVLGQVRSTGMFLFESGMPGTIQQIDLAV